MLNNFLQKQKYHTSIKYTLLFYSLLFNSISTADDKKTGWLSMNIGGYSTDYSGDFLYIVENQSGSIPFPNKVDFGIGVEYSKVINTYFTLDSSLHFSLRTNTIKGTTCRDSSTGMPVSCNISLDSRFMAISILGTYRHPIGESYEIYLGSGISINRLSHNIAYNATGYETKSISSASSSPEVNLGLKLGASYIGASNRKLYVEYMYFGETNTAKISALGVSSISIGCSCF